MYKKGKLALLTFTTGLTYLIICLCANIEYFGSHMYISLGVPTKPVAKEGEGGGRGQEAKALGKHAQITNNHCLNVF